MRKGRCAPRRSPNATSSPPPLTKVDSEQAKRSPRQAGVGTSRRLRAAAASAVSFAAPVTDAARRLLRRMPRPRRLVEGRPGAQARPRRFLARRGPRPRSGAGRPRRLPRPRALHAADQRRPRGRGDAERAGARGRRRRGLRHPRRLQGRQADGGRLAPGPRPRRRRDRGPALLRAPRRRPPRHPARGLAQLPRRRHARGRQHDHPAARAPHVPVAGAHAAAQDPGGACSRSGSSASSRKEEILVALPEHGLFRRRRLWRRCRGASATSASAPKELSLAEAAMLAGLVRAPSQLAPTRNLGRRARAGRDRPRRPWSRPARSRPSRPRPPAREPVDLRLPPETPPGTNYFVDMVAGEVKRLLGAAPADLTLRTTLDLDLQRLAEDASIERASTPRARAKNVGQAALVAMAPRRRDPRDGRRARLRGRASSTAPRRRSASRARCSSSSSISPRCRRATRPQTTVVDQPTQIGDWEPQNASGRFRGPVTLRTAFAQLDQHRRGAACRRGRHPGR